MSPIVKYDPEANAAYIRFSPEKVEDSEEVAPGIALDYDAKGRIVGSSNPPSIGPLVG